MAKKWIQGVTKKMEKKGTEGAFTASAKPGETTAQHIARVLAPESKASTKEKRRASFAKAMRSFEEGGPVTQTGPAMLHKGEYVVPADKKNGVGVEKPDKKNDNRDMKAFDDRSTLPACEEYVVPERYDQRIPDIDSNAGGNEQVEVAKVWAHGRVKKIREVQLGDPMQPIETAGNGYLGN